MTHTAVRRIQFCAGHRVYRHESKCAHLHGHNYVAFFHATATYDLDSVGRVIDFSVLKHKLGSWIEANWDHGMLLAAEDTTAIHAAESVNPSKLFLLPNNPTAENMAAYLLRTVCPQQLPAAVVVTKVVLWETENCYAEVEL